MAAGYTLSSYSHGSVPWLVLGNGVVVGAGIGFGYVCPIATCLQWFPRHKGLVTGITVAGFGGGAILLSSAAAAWEGTLDVLTMFRYIGWTYGAIVVGSSLLVVLPPARREAGKVLAIPYGALLRDGRLWTLFALMLSGTFGGLMTIGNIKPMGLAAGVPTAAATAAISVLAVGNAAGRVIWGWIMDRWGNLAIPASLTWLAGMIALLVLSGRHPGVYYVGAVGVGVGFGACLVLYAAAVARAYGPDAVGRVYPLVSLSYGAGGIVGPVVAGRIFDVTASYTPALILAAALAAGGAGFYFLVGAKVIGNREEVKAAGNG